MRLLLSSLRLLGFLALLALCAAGALALRLAQGPVSLEAFAPRLTRLVERAGPFAVTFSRPALAWSREQAGILLEVQDLEVRAAATGQLLATAPAVGLRLHTAALLRDRQVRLREVEVRLPELQLVRQADGELVLHFGGHLGALPLEQATGGGMLGNLAGGAAEARDPRLDRLRRIRIDAAGLRFTDEGSGRTAESGGARLRLTREDRGGWELRLDVAAVGGAANSRLRATATPPAAGSQARAVTVELERLPLAALDGLVPELPLAGADLPVSGELRFALEPGAPRPGPARFRLTTTGGRVAMPDVLAEPALVRGAVLAGEAGPGWREVRLGQGEVRLGADTVLRGTGTGRRGEDGSAELHLDLAAEGLEPAALVRLWPLKLAANTRRWVAEHVDAGRVPQAHLDLMLPPREGAGRRPLDYTLAFAVEGGAARFLPDWPAARGISGTALLDRERFTLAAGPGRVGEVRIAGANLAFTGLRPPEPIRLELSLAADGTVPAALDLLGREPLRLTRALGVEPGAASGQFRADVALALPVKDKIPAAEVTKRVTATLGDVGVRQLRKGYDLAAKDLRVEVDDAKADITGEVVLNGVPAGLAWRERLTPGGAGDRRRVEVKGRLDPERARALRAGWPDWASGSLGVEAVVTEAERQPRRIDVVADLAAAGVAVPELALAKAAGSPGRLEARLEQPEETRLLAREATITWPEVRLRGGGEFRLEPFAWRQLDLREVRTASAELKGTVSQDGDVVRARIEAERLDLRPIREQRDSTPAKADEGAPTPFDLDLAATRLLLGPEPLEAVTLKAARRDGRLTGADLKVRLPGGDSGSFSLQAAALPGDFRGEANDLGGLLRGLGVERSRLEGGRGRVEGRVEAREGGAVAWTGEAKLREFVVKDAPTLARILSLASLTGLGNTLSGGSGLAIDRVTLPFTVVGDRLELRQARAVGSALGARVDGTVDLASRNLDLAGTVAPLYGLTRFIGRIPVIGDILRGQKADAALAATFTVKGSVEEPQVAVNALSALVPGLVRDLFGDLLEGAERVEEKEGRD